MIKAVVTGSSNGIGKAVVKSLLFGTDVDMVYGIDIEGADYTDDRYTHIIADVSNKETLPVISNVNILINNAGVQEPGSRFIDVNLRGVINCTEKYGLQKNIRSIVNVASASAHSGSEFPEYAASKGGVLAYTKWTAHAIAKYGATCNSISPGGVKTTSNVHIMDNDELYERALQETMLHRWADEEEIAVWIAFMACINRSMTAQDILVDNGEMAKATFIW